MNISQRFSIFLHRICPIQRVQIWGLDSCWKLGPIKQLHMDPHPVGANQTTPHGTDAGCLSMGHFPCGGTRLGQGVTLR